MPFADSGKTGSKNRGRLFSICLDGIWVCGTDVHGICECFLDFIWRCERFAGVLRSLAGAPGTSCLLFCVDWKSDKLYGLFDGADPYAGHTASILLCIGSKAGNRISEDDGTVDPFFGNMGNQLCDDLDQQMGVCIASVTEECDGGCTAVNVVPDRRWGE